AARAHRGRHRRRAPHPWRGAVLPHLREARLRVVRRGRGSPPGIYLAIAKSGSAVWGLVDGHGTMDTYAFIGKGGAYQPVNCPPPPVCGTGGGEPGESCDHFNTAAGDCCSPTCTLEPAGSASPGDGDLCTPGTCDGAGTCLHENACVDQPIDGVKLKIQRSGEKQKLLWVARSRTPLAAGTPVDPSVTGATLELLSPSGGSVSMALPAAGWSVGSGGAKFKNRDAPGGSSPVRAAVLRQGRSIKVVARSTGFALDTPLVGVGLRLVSGTLATCSYFHVGTVVTDVPGRFEARGPGALSPSCDRVTLAGGVPGGGEYNPGLPPSDPSDPSGGFCSGDMLCPL